MPQLGGYSVYPGGNFSTTTPWYDYTGYNNISTTSGYFTGWDSTSITELQETINNISGLTTPDTKKEEDKPMSKYYRALQDTPNFVEGAIVLKYNDDYYKAQNDLFLTDSAEKALEAGRTPIERIEVVEKSPTWYERVYLIANENDKTTFGTKAEAQTAVNGTAVAATPASTTTK